MDLSIIIVSYNTKEILRDCLTSVYQHTHDISFEVFVVDNASQDGSPDMVKNEFPDVHLIANKDNKGFSKANNQGILRSKGDYVLLLNSDTVILDRALDLLMIFGRKKDDAGVFACRILNADRSLQYSCAHWPSFFSELMLFGKMIILNVWDPFSYYKFMEYWDHDDTREVDCLFGCFMIIKRDVFHQAGYLDENIFMYYEDVEFCRRVREQTAYKIYYTPDAQIIHLGMASANPKSYSMIKSCFTSVQYYFAKWHGRFYARIFAYTCRCIWLLEMAFLFILSFLPKCRKKYKMLNDLLK